MGRWFEVSRPVDCSTVWHESLLTSNPRTEVLRLEMLGHCQVLICALYFFQNSKPQASCRFWKVPAKPWKPRESLQKVVKAMMEGDALFWEPSKHPHLLRHVSSSVPRTDQACISNTFHSHIVIWATTPPLQHLLSNGTLTEAWC